MEAQILETKRVKLTLLALSNYKNWRLLLKKKILIYYSPSNISSSETLKDYIKIAIAEYHDKTTIPFIVYNK